MNYFVHVTDKADQDLGESFDYIDLTLKNPLAADVLIDTAEKKLAQLSTFPKRYPVVRDPFLASLGIRFVPVQSYLAFYQVDEAAQTVHILRFLYGKSSWESILKTLRGFFRSLFSLMKFSPLSSIFSAHETVLLAPGAILCYPMRNFYG